MHFLTLPSPLGPLLLAGDADGLRFLHFQHGRRPVAPQADWEPDRGALSKAVQQLTGYFAGTLRAFDLPLNPHGTPFQRRVWSELQGVPYGETVSYGEIARRIGNPQAVRAVGLANGANPISIIIPCHRIIGSSGSLVGYGGGLPTKHTLLALERGQHTFAELAAGC